MTTRIAGARQRPEAVLHVDYEAVLNQAVLNMRYTTLREIRQAVTHVPISQASGRNTWEQKDRNPADVKREILEAIDRIERTP